MDSYRMDSLRAREGAGEKPIATAPEDPAPRALSESKTVEEYRRLLHEIDERLSEIYRERRVIMEAFSEDYPPLLPPPRQRTEHQQRVARCPRCSVKLERTETE